jgi:hypothetical protein
MERSEKGGLKKGDSFVSCAYENNKHRTDECLRGILPESGMHGKRKHRARQYRDPWKETATLSMLGYATSLSAWIGGDLAHPGVDLSVFLHWLAIHGEKYLERKQWEFGVEV